MPISCHFRDCKALLVANLTRVRSKYRTFTLTFAFIPLGVKRLAAVVVVCVVVVINVYKRFLFLDKKNAFINVFYFSNVFYF